MLVRISNIENAQSLVLEGVSLTKRLWQFCFEQMQPEVVITGGLKTLVSKSMEQNNFNFHFHWTLRIIWLFLAQLLKTFTL